MDTNGHTILSEDYVSFEVAKLLKEKGFDEATYSYYMATKTLNVRFYTRMHVEEEPVFNSVEKKSGFEEIWSAPTQQMAMKWLREIHGYYIQVMLDGWALGSHTGYYVLIQKTDSDFELMLADAVDKVFYETYEEAVEVSLKYVLENLI